MPVNAIGTDQLSGIEEESDIYEAFAPHVDTANISVLTDTPPGRLFLIFFAAFLRDSVTTKNFENRWVMCCGGYSRLRRPSQCPRVYILLWWLGCNS